MDVTWRRKERDLVFKLEPLDMSKRMLWLVPYSQAISSYTVSTENGHHGWKVWWIRRREIQVLLEKYLPKNTTEENKYGMELFDSKWAN